MTTARIAVVITGVKNMKYRTTPYILEKEGVYYSFQSEKDAMSHNVANCHSMSQIVMVCRLHVKPE